MMVGWADVIGFGPDGIVVNGDGALRPPGDDRERAVAGGDLDLDGRLVLDDRGDSPGALTDVVFDEALGRDRRVRVRGPGDPGGAAAPRSGRSA